MERKSGFYWVKKRADSEWQVAWYSANSVTWFFWGVPHCSKDSRCHKDSDMGLINENRIMSPDEWE